MTQTTSTDAELWSVHVLGMDDLMPTVSRMLAVRNATWLNLGLSRSYDRYAEPGWPMAYYVPVVWDGTPEGHAEALAAEEKRDRRWSDPAAKVIDDLAAAMFLRLEAVRAGLEAVLSEQDYDLHKAIKANEETGEDDYPKVVDAFAHAYRRAL